MRVAVKQTSAVEAQSGRSDERAAIRVCPESPLSSSGEACGVVLLTVQETGCDTALRKSSARRPPATQSAAPGARVPRVGAGVSSTFTFVFHIPVEAAQSTADEVRPEGPPCAHRPAEAPSFGALRADDVDGGERSAVVVPGRRDLKPPATEAGKSASPSTRHHSVPAIGPRPSTSCARQYLESDLAPIPRPRSC